MPHQDTFLILLQNRSTNILLAAIIVGSMERWL